MGLDPGSMQHQPSEFQEWIFKFSLVSVSLVK